ncbi:MAG TPA: hypothetical protein VG897_08635 [Terriglobales bacterium]|nr:hypothetical protein [Terriglobales bacterium]
MTESLKLNSFERVLFALAIGVGAVVVVVRLGAIALTWYLHHSR